MNYLKLAICSSNFNPSYINEPRLNMPLQYGSFSDESRHTGSRYRSIAAVSLPAKAVPQVQEDLVEILSDSDVSELKWKKLKGAKYRFCANKFIDHVINNLIQQGCRIDVLIWDVHDDRHDIPGRDDIQNFERMYFHLHKNLMNRREYEAVWHLRPDRRSAVDWENIHSCLGSVGRWRSYFEHPLLEDEFTERFFRVRTLKEVSSKDQPLCQLADLFAGMGPYSLEKSDIIKHLFESDQGSLFPDDSPHNISSADPERFKVINHLYHRSKSKRLGVSLRSNFYLQTRDPTNPINFWHYKPQHDLDRAPTSDD